MFTQARLGHSCFRPSRAPRRLQGWAQVPQEDLWPLASTHLPASLGPCPTWHVGRHGCSALGCPLAAPWPDTETPCLLLVDVFSGSLVSGVASSKKPSALGGHPAKHSRGNCECFYQGHHHIVCAFICSAPHHMGLTSANHVSQAPSLVMASVRSHRWEAMAGGWRTRREEAGVFLTLFWWRLWQGLPFLHGLGPRWLTLVPGCC